MLPNILFKASPRQLAPRPRDRDIIIDLSRFVRRASAAAPLLYFAAT